MPKRKCCESDKGSGPHAAGCPNAEHLARTHRPRCIICHQPLTIPDGYAGSGMCGPCCTGSAATLEEIGETW